MSKKTSQDAPENPENKNSAENVAGSHTVEASFNFGQFLVSLSHEVNSETLAKLANEGFKSIAQNASSKLDSTKEFGNFGHKGPNGKPVERSKSYKRGDVKFSPELAEIVRQFCATHTFANETVAATVSRYESTAVKAVTVDQAGLIVAKNAIVKRGDNAQELDKLAKMVSFEYSATAELTVENDAFVQAVATFYANL